MRLPINVVDLGGILNTTFVDERMFGHGTWRTYARTRTRDAARGTIHTRPGPLVSLVTSGGSYERVFVNGV